MEKGKILVSVISSVRGTSSIKDLIEGLVAVQLRKLNLFDEVIEGRISSNALADFLLEVKIVTFVKASVFNVLLGMFGGTNTIGIQMALSEMNTEHIIGNFELEGISPSNLFFPTKLAVKDAVGKIVKHTQELLAAKREG